MVSVLSTTEDRLLTTSYKTVGKSPDAFYASVSVKKGVKGESHVFLSGFLPVYETNGIWIAGAQRNEFDIGLG